MELTFIQKKIYDIRGQRVMLDFDISELYHVETKRLNEQVKRNIDRFPEEFMFRLNPKEWDDMRSQIVTASSNASSMRSQFATASQKKRNILATPFAFTEHGVTMLASILRSETAIKMNIAVVKAFIAFRKIVVQHNELSEKIEQLRLELFSHFGEYDMQLSRIYDVIENLLDEKAEQKSWNDRELIGFKNEGKLLYKLTVRNKDRKEIILSDLLPVKCLHSIVKTKQHRNSLKRKICTIDRFQIFVRINRALLFSRFSISDAFHLQGSKR